MTDKNYYEDGEPKRCQKCRCKQLREKVEDRLDGHTIMEMSVHCKSCGAVVGYWAYGYWEPRR